MKEVLFSPPDDGWLHRAVDIDGEVHIMEELQLFEQAQPVESMAASSSLVSAAELMKGFFAKVMQIKT